LIDRILIVGLGSVGKRHLRLAREVLPEAEIAVLRHEVTSSIPEFADRIFSTIDHVLEFAPNVAVIANPATFHLCAAMPLANAGAHLLIEKPLSNSISGLADLLFICQQKGSILTTGYNLRFSKSLQKFKSLLEAKVIGTIWSVRCESGKYLPYWRSETDYRQGVSAQHALGGGVLLELSHEIDYLRWIFGEVNWVQASLIKQSDLDVDVEDSAHLTMGFDSKDCDNQIVAALNLDFIRQDATRSCTAIGKLGSLRWNAMEDTVELWALGSQGWQEIYRHKTNNDDTYHDEWKSFLASIELKQIKHPASTGEDGLEVLRVIEAARLANKTKCQVSVGDTH